MRALFLVLCFAAVGMVLADHCPEGMSGASASERRDLQAIGEEAFTMWAKKACDQMPVYITELSAFDTDVEPLCTTASGDAAYFKVTFNNPCKGGTADAVFMTVDTKPSRCRKTYDPKLAKWGWHTKTHGNMRPLQCPKGFRKAGRKDKELLTAFLFKQFTKVEMPRLRRKGSRFYCPAGIEALRFHYVNGCVQIWPKGVSPYVMSQGKVDYTCYGASKTLKLGLDGEGKYKTLCKWKVSFDN